MGAKSRVKGITIEIGGDTVGLDKALKDVNKTISNTEDELKDVERLLKLDPTNTELLKQKFQLLNKQVENTETKLQSLKNAEKEVQKQFEKGDIGEDQYNALRREIIETENKLKEFKKKAKETENAINSIDEKPIEDVEKAADEAGKELKDAGKEASNFGDYLKAGAIVEGTKAIISSLKNVSEESKNYQKIMGSLEISSQAAGYSAEETADTYKQLYGVLADDQTAATTTANLQALGLSQKQLTQMTNAAIGAWATYGDSIPIDSLSEAINETSKTGKVTGVLADALNWAGVSEDAFNEKLASSSDESERANMILEQLTSQGLTNAGEAWRKNNEALVENNEANADMQEQMSELSELVMPIITDITSAVADLLSWFNALDTDTQKVILTVIALVAAIGPLTSALGGLSTLISFIAANPIVAIIAAVVGLVTVIAACGDDIQKNLQKVDDFLQNVFAHDWTENFGAFGEVLNGFFANVKNIWNAIKKIFDGIIDFIRGVFTGDWERAWKGIQEIFGGVFDGLIALAKRPINLIIGFINALIEGVETAINFIINGLNKLSFKTPDWLPGSLGGKKFGFDLDKVNFTKLPYLAKGGILYNGSAVVGEAGPELLTVMGNKAKVEPLTQSTSTTTNMGAINIYVYSSPGQDVRELAELVSEKINDSVNRKGAAFG